MILVHGNEVSGMDNEVYHYGIKGMKWGVRRYQNKDGTLTNTGKKRLIEERRTKNTAKTQNDVENIISSLNKKERERMGLVNDNDKYKTPDEYKLVVKRCMEKIGDIPISFFDLNEYDSGYNAVVATRSGKEYRGKSYALKVVKRGLDWYDKNKSNLDKPIIWWAEKNNIGSQKLAEKAGFERDFSIEESDDEWLKENWVKYTYK